MGSMNNGSARIVAGGALALVMAATSASAVLAQGGQEAENATDSGGAIMVWLES